MTQVFVDVEAASIAPAAQDASRGGGARWAADPEAVRALRYLAESGVQVTIITTGGVEPAADLTELAGVPLTAVPARPTGQCWYLTSAIERCQGSSAHLRTVLIGGAPPNGSVRRCDAVARDIHAAAMEILASEAMGAQANHVA